MAPLTPLIATAAAATFAIGALCEMWTQNRYMRLIEKYKLEGRPTKFSFPAGKAVEMGMWTAGFILLANAFSK